MRAGSNVIPTDVAYSSRGESVTAYERKLLLKSIADGNILQLQKPATPFSTGEIFLPIHEIIITRDSAHRFTVAARHNRESLFFYGVNMEDGCTCTLSLANGLHAFKRYILR